MTKAVSKKRLLDGDRQSIVWAIIERIAFRPRAAADIAKWFTLYENNITSLLQLPHGDVAIERQRGFEVKPLRICCKYNHEKLGAKYDIELELKEGTSHLLWSVHVDPVNVSKAGFYSEVRPYQPQDIKKHLEDDIKAVLHGMIFHPRNHTHLEDCGLANCELTGDALGLHEIRVGGAIENLFVFLFHLRYQLCLVSECAREDERRRLMVLFESAIKDKKRNISPNELFNL